MGFFNDALVEALLSGRYVCSICGSLMYFEDEWEDILVCDYCGHSVELDRYGCESDEEYDVLYPSEAEILGCEADDIDDESYEEVYGNGVIDN